jgi:uncharacterized iron-regulated membrane protein
MANGRSAQHPLRQAGGGGSLLPALLCALLPVVSLAAPAEQAQRHQQKQQERQGQGPPRQVISLDQAIAMAEQRHNARVVRASTTESEGRQYHVLRLLSQEGRVWTVRIDAVTGQER